MRKVKEVIVVEGKYDKNTLSQVVDAVILETSGFGIFHDREKRKLLETLAEKKGLIILTDSDAAGFQIRNHIKGLVDPALVRHAYIPDIYGKERRKNRASREGKLGVEGMRPDLLIDSLISAGATFEDEERTEDSSPHITKSDLYVFGLSGRENSAEKRSRLKKKLGLPERLGTDALLDFLNVIMTREELYHLVSSSEQTETETEKE